MDLAGIKNWLDESIALMENNPTDSTPERIEENRKRWGQAFRKKEEIKTWVIANKPAALPYLVELKTWLEDYYHYFSPSFYPVSGETIDTLPELILERLKWIRTRLDSL